jgi:Transposase IS4
MEDYSDLDTSSESEYESDQESTHRSNGDIDELYENLEPELSETIHDKYENAPWNPEAQLQAQSNATRLAQLHADIKARAQLPDPTYEKLPRSWPIRPFDVRILPDYIQHPIHYFELFWGPEVWNTLIENTNAYAQYKEARHKENQAGKSRWWKAVTLYEMRIFIALLIYMSIVGTSSIRDYWNKSSLTIHKPMESMTLFRFQQIMRYFHVSALGHPKAHWHTKLEPLTSLLRTKFKAYVVLGQDVSFDEMMVPFAGRSKHTLKMKNKPVKEGFKIWALCDHGYLWDFLFYSRTTGKLIY